MKRKYNNIKIILFIIFGSLLHSPEMVAQFVPPPTLISPENNSVNLSPPVTLVWDHSSAISYRVQVATDGSFSNLLIDVSDITDTYYELNTLTPGTTFYWRVNASTLVFTSDWSVIWDFTTAAGQTVPSTPDLVSPLNGATNISLNPVLSWENISNADFYRLQVAEDAAFNDKIFDDSTITSSSIQVGPLSNGIQYFWRVNARNSAGSSGWSSVWNFTTTVGQTIPATPYLVSPVNGATNVSLNPVLSWQNISNADFYRLQVAEDAAFNNKVFDDSTIITSTFQVGPLSNGTQYYWRVNARNNAGSSGWSSAWNFTTNVGQTIPASPTLISPANGATDVSLNPVLSWQNVSNADYYRLQVAVDGFFNNKVFDDSSISVSYIQIGPLSGATQYYWRVNARNSVGVSSWSTVWNFTTSLVQTAPSAPALVSPTNGTTDISLSPVLSWQSISNADFYRLQVAEDASFIIKVFDDSTIANSFRQIGPLNEGTQYYWRVNARNSAGTSNWSNIWNFITIEVQTIPSAPSLVFPPDNEIDESLHPILTWENVSGADSYWLQVATDGSFNQIAYNDTAVFQNYRQIGMLEMGTEYFWHVKAKNSAGSSSWSVTWSFTTVYDENLVPLLISPDDGLRNIPLTMICSWETMENAQKYQILVSAQPDFSSLFIDDSTTAVSIQLENLSSYTTYFWKVRAKIDGTWQLYCAPWQFTTRASTPTYINVDTSISFPFYNDLSQYKSTDYKIIGIPGSSQIPIIDFLPGNFGRDWQAYWDNGSPDDYLIEYNASSFFYSVGKAFWIIKKGSMQVSAVIENAPLNSRNNIEIPLHSGWNLITNPIINSVPWDSIKAINGITEPIYSFNGSYSLSQMLMPFKGYYFFNASNLILLEVPTEISDSLTVLYQPFAKLKSDKGWIVNIKLQSEGYTDSIAWIGTSSLVTNELNQFNIHKPRNWGSLPSIYFSRPEWDEDYPDFACDFRSIINESAEWTFEVTSTPWKSATLIFNLEELPSNFDICLFNTSAKKWIDLRANAAYQFTSVAEKTSFRLMVGKGIKNNLTFSNPEYYTLGNNFPNPFNLSTTIPIIIPEKSDIEIKIFNILGDQIKTIYKGLLEAGEYSFSWDGTDNNGDLLCSGIYFYRFTTRQFVDVKKMVLLK